MTTQSLQPPESYTPLHEHVTDIIIKQLEAGIVPWQQPWKDGKAAPFSIPSNATTGNKYQGINILLLWASAIGNQHDTAEWASYKQWQHKGASVRKGEKGTMIVYYDILEREVDDEIKKIPFLKSSYVFNKSQLMDYVPQERTPPEPFVNTIPKVEEFINSTGARIDNEDYGACYVGLTDRIYMPYPCDFVDTDRRSKEEAYYAVLMHELVHWTGHPQRLSRKFGKTFQDEKYAVEELVAEMGAAFLCADLQITTTTTEDHAAYIERWLKRLQDNKQQIIKAASEASKAANYLHSLKVAKQTPVPE